MIKKYEIENTAGSFYEFPNNNVLINAVTGLGAPAARSTVHEYTNTDGGIFLAQNYKMRNIGISGLIYGNSIAAFEQAKNDFVGAFTFRNALKQLKLTNQNDVVYTADVIISDSADIQISEQPDTILHCYFTLQLTAPDGLLYSETSQTVEGSVTTITGGTAIPATVPLSLAGGFTNSISVNNQGNTPVYPTSIRITAPGTNFTITNQTTGETFTINTTLTGSDYIDVYPKTKEVYKNGATNMYQYFTGTWFKMENGSNIITFSVASGSTSSTKLQINWKNGYISA